MFFLQNFMFCIQNFMPAISKLYACHLQYWMKIGDLHRNNIRLPE